ncbi:putative acid phosphatase [Escovopsis weberi]|uniref:3-phytase n=1 Tax=Escovopsis weberi TaxID=150374 RepID=A0A0M9VTM7_ESCWE|nr:putative acid phosphatase [Escovopsis weberi]
MSLEPRPEYTDAELAGLYPPQLRLQQVQVLLRHGERTPVSTRFLNAGLPPHWPYCSAVRQLRAAVLDGPPPSTPAGDPPRRTFSKVEWRQRLETFGRDDDSPVVAAGPNGELDAICDAGMLTDRGRETTHALGARLRRLYVDRLGFLPPSIDNDDAFYLRATPIPRALESMQQAFHGLYPPHTRAPAFPPLTILSRPVADENLFPNEGSCRRLAELARAFAQRTADRWNTSNDMAYVNTRIGKWMPDSSPRVAVDSRPRLSGVMDTINATRAHGPVTRLPKEFYDPGVRKIIEKIGTEEWFAGYRESREYRALGIGSLLGDLVSRMVLSAEQASPDLPKKNTAGSAPFRFGLNGCHDTTLGAILTSLGAFSFDKWPPFTSHIAIELFRSAEHESPRGNSNTPARSWWPPAILGTSSARGIGRKPSSELSDKEKESLQGYFVRLRYNDEPVAIPGCRPQGKHLDGDETFCTLEAFKAIVDKFTPQNWKQECRLNIKMPAFPPGDETAGH